MGGRIYFTILGLLLVQLLASFFMSYEQNLFLTEIIFAAIFLIFTFLYLFASASTSKGAYIIAALAFCLGFLNIVFLVLASISLWLVVLLSLAAVGLFLSLDQIEDMQKKARSKKKKTSKPIPEIQIYNQKTKKKTAKKRATKKKVTKKKTTKKKTAKKKKTSKK